MSKLVDFFKQFIIASVETSTKLDPIDHFLFSSALDLIAGLIFRVKTTQDHTAETLSRIEKKLDDMRVEQRTEHFDAAFQLLQDVPTIHGASERKRYIEEAIFELNRAATSETNSSLTRAETFFWIGYCYWLIKQHDAAIQKYAQSCNLMINGYIGHLVDIFLVCFVRDVFERTGNEDITIRTALLRYRNLSSTLSMIEKSEFADEFRKYCSEEIIVFFEFIFDLVRKLESKDSLIKDFTLTNLIAGTEVQVSPTDRDTISIIEETIKVSKAFLGLFPRWQLLLN